MCHEKIEHSLSCIKLNEDYKRGIGLVIKIIFSQSYDEIYTENDAFVSICTILFIKGNRAEIQSAHPMRVIDSGLKMFLLKSTLGM